MGLRSRSRAASALLALFLIPACQRAKGEVWKDNDPSYVPFPVQNLKNWPDSGGVSPTVWSGDGKGTVTVRDHHIVFEPL